MCFSGEFQQHGIRLPRQHCCKAADRHAKDDQQERAEQRRRTLDDAPRREGDFPRPDVVGEERAVHRGPSVWLP